jgi:hypothetical protein
LLDKLLVVDPATRLTSEQAIRHVFLHGHPENEEPIGQVFDDSFEQENLTLDQLKG